MLACIVNPDSADPRLAPLTQLLEELDCEKRWAETLDAAINHPNILAGSDSLIVVPTTAAWKPDIGQIIQHAAQVVGRAFLLYIADEISPGDYKALLRLGAADSTDWKSAPTEIRTLVHRLKQEGTGDKKAPAGISHHCMVSFVGTGGGAGNTTIAIETGVYLASMKGAESRRVALLDLDFRQSVACDYLDATPRLDLAAFARNPQRLDDYMLDIFSSRHSSGLDVFACNQLNADDGAVSDEIIFLLLNRLLTRYEYVLVDVPSNRLFEADEILRNSDLVILTGLFSVPSVKKVARASQRLKDIQVPQARTAAVITDADVNLFGGVVQRFNVESALPGERIFYVRRDRSFSLESADAGHSMIQTRPSRGICKDITKIGDLVKSITPAKLS